MDIKLLIDAGDMKPGPAVAQQLGPMGINMGKVISKVNQTTQEFKGMKIPVILEIDEKTKEFIVKTSSPPTSELLKKELNFEKGSADQKIYVANASIGDIIKVAKIKYLNMLQKDFKSAVKSVLGTCAAGGILVENKNSNDLIRSLRDSDKYDKDIEEKKTETAPERRTQLEEYFSNIKKAQDDKIAQAKALEEEAEKKSEEGKTKEETKSEEPEEPSKEPGAGKK